MNGPRPERHRADSARALPHVVYASGAGLPLLLLHGFLGDAGDWQPLADAIGSLRPGPELPPIAAVDLPGHGRATGRDEADYSLAGTADACLATADALGWSRFAVAGYSMGGRVAYHLALAAPDRAAALVAVSAHPGLTDPAQRADRLAADEERARRLARDPVAFLADWYRQPLFVPLAASAGLEALVAHRLEAADGAELAKALTGLSTGRQEPLGERLRAAGVPALLVSGRLDTRYDRLLADLAGLVPTASHVPIDGAGHAVHLERPDALARTLLEFTERTSHVLH